MKIKTPLFFLLFLLTFTARARQNPEVRTGDIIFQHSSSDLHEAIRDVTGSEYSHVGIIFVLESGPVVFEAVQPVCFTPLAAWTARGRKKHYVIKRLKNRELLTKKVKEKLLHLAFSFEGKSYDGGFRWSDDRMYCSEVVWKMYDRAAGLSVGEKQKLRDLNLESATVKRELNRRYGKNIPYDETVISPIAVFRSPLLETIFSN